MEYYFNNVKVQNFSEPKPNYSFRDGEFWIKVFSSDAYFKNEIKMLDAVSGCPGTVGIQQVGTASIVSAERTESFHAIKEAYVEGNNIKTYCKKHYEESDILSVFLKLAQALSEIESRGIIHNDIKPQNILVDENAEPVLIDFGISKFIDEPAEPIHLNYTERYCAPEKRAGNVSVMSDIYSFGCVLYTCVWQNPSGPSGYSKMLKAVYERCLDKTPENRYKSFRELVLALSNVETQMREDNPITRQAKPKRIFKRFKEFVRRRGTALISVPLYGFGLFFLLLAIYMILWGPNKPKSHIPNPKEDIKYVIDDIRNKHNQISNEKRID